MKILGSLLSLFGLGTLFSTIFNYWIWYQLKSAQSPDIVLSGADQRLVEDYGYGSFLAFILLGVIAFYAGI